MRVFTLKQPYDLKVAGFEKSIGIRGESKELEGISSTSNLQAVILKCAVSHHNSVLHTHQDISFLPNCPKFSLVGFH